MSNSTPEPTLVAPDTQFARLKGSKTVHVIPNGETLCGGDLIEEDSYIQAERWYSHGELSELPDSVQLCPHCDRSWSVGTTLSAIELANCLRDVADLDHRESAALSKKEKIALLKEFQENRERGWQMQGLSTRKKDISGDFGHE